MLAVVAGRSWWWSSSRSWSSACGPSETLSRTVEPLRAWPPDGLCATTVSIGCVGRHARDRRLEALRRRGPTPPRRRCCRPRSGTSTLAAALGDVQPHLRPRRDLLAGRGILRDDGAGRLIGEHLRGRDREAGVDELAAGVALREADRVRDGRAARPVRDQQPHGGARRRPRRRRRGSARTRCRAALAFDWRAICVLKPSAWRRATASSIRSPRTAGTGFVSRAREVPDREAADRAGRAAARSGSTAAARACASAARRDSPRGRPCRRGARACAPPPARR